MKKIKVAFLAIATLTLLATSAGCHSRKVASAQASDTSSGVIVPGATVKGAIEGSKVFIAGRTVTIPSLWVCDHEVTQGEYEKYCTYNGYRPDSESGLGENYPAFNVSWNNALVYCNKRSIAEGLTPCYKIKGKTNPIDWGEVPAAIYEMHSAVDNDPAWDAVSCDFNANGYRLPTEAEWEYLARGGNTSNSGQTKYSGSDDIEAVAWYVGNSGCKTHEVKTKAPNALGLYDMSGNVGEWCWDWFSDTITTDTPSSGAASGSDLSPNRVFRGGGCDDEADSIDWERLEDRWVCWSRDCRVACTTSGQEHPRYGYRINGFRVVRTVSKNDAESTSAKNESDKKTASNGGANKPLTVTGQIADSEVFIKGRTVEIWAKWCCNHEVTQEEYQSVMGENPSENSGSNKPVEMVSWYDAIMYCNKRSIADGRTPCYKVDGNADTSQWGYTPHKRREISGAITCDFTADGYRLPTEAEWEYFARGGNLTNSNQTTYSGSNTIESVAWYGDLALTREVKKKAANALGLYDMSGNVEEWCWDWHGSISTSTPSSGAASGYRRVRRGGCWFSGASICTVSYRGPDYPRIRSNGLGFRVVCFRSE